MKHFFTIIGLILLYYIAALACNILGFFHPFLWVYSALPCAILTAWPYCKLVKLYPRFGMALLTTAVVTLIYLAMGEGDMLYIWLSLAIGIAAEVARLAGGYRSFTSRILGYCIITLLPFANTLRMWIDRDNAMAMTNTEMGADYTTQMAQVLSPWLLALIIVCTLILAAIMALVCYHKEYYQYMLDNCSKPHNNWFGSFLLRFGMNQGHKILTKFAFENVQIGQERDVLDIGCGGGHNLSVYLNRLPQAKVYGLDYSEKSVEVSRQVNIREVNQGRCIVMQGNVAELPFETESFDFVSAFETIYFWPDIQDCFKGIYKIVRPGGRFMVTGDVPELATKWANDYEGMHVYTAQQVSDMMKTAGFSKVETYNNKVAMVIVGTK